MKYIGAWSILATLFIINAGSFYFLNFLGISVSIPITTIFVFFISLIDPFKWC